MLPTVGFRVKHAQCFIAQLISVSLMYTYLYAYIYINRRRSYIIMSARLAKKKNTFYWLYRNKASNHIASAISPTNMFVR